MSQVTTIRPHVLFARLDEAKSNTLVSLVVPSLNKGIGYGSPDFLETICLLALLKLRNPRRIFEFGTYTGQGATQFAANAPEAEVVTLDIPPEELAALSNPTPDNQHSRVEDNDLRDTSARISGIIIDRAADEPYHGRIRRLLHNSMTLDVAAQGLSQGFDFIFIDGGHDYATVRSDTEKAFEMARGKALIAWHDYTSPTHTDVQRYIDELSESRKIYHIGNTTVAFSWEDFSVI